MYRMIEYKPPEITKGNPYPEFAQAIGWALTAFVLCPIPLTFIYKFVRAKGGFVDRLREITTPQSDWGPNDGTMKQNLTNTLALEQKYGLDNNGAVHENGLDNPKALNGYGLTRM